MCKVAKNKKVTIELVFSNINKNSNILIFVILKHGFFFWRKNKFTFAFGIEIHFKSLLCLEYNYYWYISWNVFFLAIYEDKLMNFQHKNCGCTLWIFFFLHSFFWRGIYLKKFCSPGFCCVFFRTGGNGYVGQEERKR